MTEEKDKGEGEAVPAPGPDEDTRPEIMDPHAGRRVPEPTPMPPADEAG